MAEQLCSELEVFEGEPPACNEGEYRCVGTQRQLCQGGQWVNVSDPGNICGGTPENAIMSITELIKLYPPGNPAKNSDVVVQATLKNTGTTIGSAKVKFLIGGSEQLSEQLVMMPGSSMGVQAAFVAINPGTIQVCASAFNVYGGVAGDNKCMSIVVEDTSEPGNIWDKIRDYIENNKTVVALGAGVLILGVVTIGAVKMTQKEPEYRRRY